MSHPFRTRRLGDILVEKGFIEGEIEASAGARLGETLLGASRVTGEQLAEALAAQFELPYAALDGHTVPRELFELIPATLAYQYGVAPVAASDGTLRVAVSDPTDLRLIENLERLARRRVEIVVSSSAAIQAALKRAEGAAEVLRDASEDFRLVMVQEADDGAERIVSLDAPDATESPVVRLVNTILMAAIQKRASDVHIEAYERGVVVKYRIDGVLYPATELLDRRHHAAVVSRLKVMAELDIAEKRVPQDGRFKLRLGRRDIDFRVSVLPSVFGEDVVIRVLDKSGITEGMRTLSLEGLGVEPEALKRLRRAIREPYGMVLITGPTGSGKTTTLYAALTEINSGEEKIITIEDPVEYQLEGVVQIPVNEKKGLTFARGLRSVLRHDPDKIMVGEIRDVETAQIAVQSALTGHLVFTTVHANNVLDVIGRFTHMGLDLYNFVSALNCVMAQRLVRRLCPHCRAPARVEPALLELSGLDPARYLSHVWYEGRGCEHCGGTGYRGRSAITELLDLSPRIRDLIVARRPTSELLAAALEEGMTTLRQSALAKALAGETTLKEINRVTFVE
jgi:type IV pilus assembly protein PilB